MAKPSVKETSSKVFPEMMYFIRSESFSLNLKGNKKKPITVQKENLFLKESQVFIAHHQVHWPQFTGSGLLKYLENPRLQLAGRAYSTTNTSSKMIMVFKLHSLTTGNHSHIVGAMVENEQIG